MNQIAVVTGAFGYSGSYIARKLLLSGWTVRTLTSSRPAGELARQIEARPLAFDRPQELIDSLRGARVLINTYWVRFDIPGRPTQEQAVQNTLRLFDSARKAGIERIVHLSITNPSEGSPYAYFRHKAAMERHLKTSGVPHSILRPAVLFGGRDILVNNIAWTLRKMPVVGLFGDGQYKLQPIHVEDLADLAVREAACPGSRTIDAIGPETFTYRGLFETLSEILNVHRPIVSMPPRVAYAAVVAAGKLMGDVILTWPEVQALMDGLLATDSPPAGQTKLSDWARAHADELGREYHSELAKRK